MTPAHRRLERLYDDHAAAVLAYARRRARPDVADDVLSETFVVAWRRLGEVPIGAERPWLLGVARKVLGNQLRGERRRGALGERLLHELPSRSAPAGDDPEGDVPAALAALPQPTPPGAITAPTLRRPATASCGEPPLPDASRVRGPGAGRAGAAGPPRRAPSRPRRSAPCGSCPPRTGLAGTSGPPPPSRAPPWRRSRGSSGSRASCTPSPSPSAPSTPGARWTTAGRRCGASCGSPWTSGWRETMTIGAHPPLETVSDGREIRTYSHADGFRGSRPATTNDPGAPKLDGEPFEARTLRLAERLEQGRYARLGDQVVDGRRLVVIGTDQQPGDAHDVDQRFFLEPDGRRLRRVETLELPFPAGTPPSDHRWQREEILAFEVRDDAAARAALDVAPSLRADTTPAPPPGAEPRAPADG